MIPPDKVTVTLRVAVWLAPPVTVKVHFPAPTGVTVKTDVELAGEIVAMPLQLVPEAVKLPEYPVSLAVVV
jgi:hypothetical protein